MALVDYTVENNYEGAEGEEVLGLVARYMQDDDVNVARWASRYVMRNMQNHFPEEKMLLPYQIPNFHRLVGRLQKRQSALDYSVMGTGKTYVACAIAKTLRLKMVVISPNSLIPMWKRVSKETGATLSHIVGYEMLRSFALNNGKSQVDTGDGTPLEYKNFKPNPKNPWLKPDRDRILEANDKKEIKPMCTDKWRDLVESGVLVIFDESHKTKNKSLQTRCSQTLVKAIYEDPLKTSKVLLLSATPGNHRDHFVSLAYMLGIMQTHPVARYVIDSGYRLLGYREMINALPDEAIDPKTGEECTPRQTFEERVKNCESSMNLNRMLSLTSTMAKEETVERSTDELKNELETAFCDYILPLYSSSMPLPPINASIDIRNGFYSMDKPSLDALMAARRRVEGLCGFRSEDWDGGGGIDGRNVDWTGLGSALMDVELAMVSTFFRLAMENLMCVENSKVILMMGYLEPINQLASKFRDAGFKTLCLTGKVKKIEERLELCDKFNRPDTEYRVIICNRTVGGLGISLHDTHGGFPRYIYTGGDFRVIDIHQCLGRAVRSGLMSDVVGRIVYSADVPMSNIFNALAERSTHIRNMTRKNKDVKYPAEHPIYIEPGAPDPTAALSVPPQNEDRKRKHDLISPDEHYVPYTQEVHPDAAFISTLTVSDHQEMDWMYSSGASRVCDSALPHDDDDDDGGVIDLSNDIY